MAMATRKSRYSVEPTSNSFHTYIFFNFGDSWISLIYSILYLRYMKIQRLIKYHNHIHIRIHIWISCKFGCSPRDANKSVKVGIQRNWIFVKTLDYLVHIDHGIFQSTGAGFRPSTFSRCSENLGGPFWNLFALQKCRVCRAALAKYTWFTRIIQSPNLYKKHTCDLYVGRSIYRYF